ncbi:MAG: DUF3313 family protein [Woeseiaceae bacterium]
MIGKQKRTRAFLQGAAMAITATLIMSGVAIAADDDALPQATPEGLKLSKQTKHRVVYLADDVDFSAYNKVLIVDCAVAFAKNWQRDYNRSERDLSRQVRDNDVTRIKEGLAAEFRKVFTQTMTDNGIEVVTEPASDVVILRPAIVNLVVNAPDLNSPGMTRTYTSDAGQMTLYLELYDSVSGAMLAKVMDAQGAGRTSPMMSYSSRATNIQAADRVLRGWATELAGHFGAATETDETAED